MMIKMLIVMILRKEHIGTQLSAKTVLLIVTSVQMELLALLAMLDGLGTR